MSVAGIVILYDSVKGIEGLPSGITLPHLLVELFFQSRTRLLKIRNHDFHPSYEHSYHIAGEVYIRRV